jgi:hypothetical protein
MRVRKRKVTEGRGEDIIYWEFYIQKGQHTIASVQLYKKYDPKRNQEYGSIENLFIDSPKHNHEKSLLSSVIQYAEDSLLYKLICICGVDSESIYTELGFQRQDISLQLEISKNTSSL